MHRPLPPALSLSQAIDGAPSLAFLAQQVEQSVAMYQSVQTLLPSPLRAHIRPGPIEGQDWCLMVGSSAVAAKLRQMLPLILQRLQSQGWNIATVRVKLMKQR